ncbi:MAG: Fe-S cluster assembly protein SufD, partial [Calditrichaeota bacterium]
MSKIDVTQQNMVEWYVTNFYAFENHLNGKKDAAFHQTRKEAIDSFARLGFPTPRTEQWKYTRLTPLLKHKFAPTVEAPAVSPDTVHKFAFAGSEDRLVVFVNGRYSPELSTLQVETGGVLVGNLEQALEEHRELIERHFSRYADYRKEPFVALNTAYALDGAFVYLAEGVELERPVHLLFLSDSSGGSFFANPRNLIILERNAGARIIESYHGLGESPYFTNGVTEVVEADRARLDHVKIQEEGSAGFHIYNLQVHMGRESVHRTVNVDLGGRLVRNNLNLSLMGEYGEGHLNGLYVGSARQHIDNHTFMDHAVPHCESNELY